MGDSNEKVDYTELSKSSISDKIKPKKRSHFVSKSKLRPAAKGNDKMMGER